MGLGDDLVKDVSDLVKDLDERSDLGSLGVKRSVLEVFGRARCGWTELR